ncbi:hypothetical protein [Oceanobacillus locisalsi]|uniref:Potassium transporter n=1 Tax=Oceanobacillus locisalsi TaxID=546107 RepID=A0ABW3NI32_9BACI
MKQLFQENRNAFLLILILLFVLSFTTYFFFVRPLAADLQDAASQEASIQNEIAELEAREEQLEMDTAEENKEAEKLKQEQIIPDTAELESFLLTLNEIELLSNSRINEMSFGYDGEVPEREVSEEQEEEGATEEEAEDKQNTEESEASEAVEAAEEETKNANEEQNQVIDMTETPAGLQPIIVTLQIQSPDYEQFQMFLQEIEKQERAMFVTNLEFEKPAERELVIEESSETMTATVDITTFYYEGEE